MPSSDIFTRVASIQVPNNIYPNSTLLLPTTALNGWTASLTEYFYKSLGISAQFT